MSDSDEDDTCKAIVMDNGSLYTKAGFASYDEPKVVFETAIGIKPTNDNKNESLIGSNLDAQKHDKNIKINYPFKFGRCKDFDALEKIWHYTLYNALKIKPEEHD
eukprot:734917_1